MVEISSTSTPFFPLRQCPAEIRIKIFRNVRATGLIQGGQQFPAFLIVSGALKSTVDEAIYIEAQEIYRQHFAITVNNQHLFVRLKKDVLSKIKHVLLFVSFANSKAFKIDGAKAFAGNNIEFVAVNISEYDSSRSYIPWCGYIRYLALGSRKSIRSVIVENSVVNYPQTRDAFSSNQEASAVIIDIVASPARYGSRSLMLGQIQEGSSSGSRAMLAVNEWFVREGERLVWGWERAREGRCCAF